MLPVVTITEKDIRKDFDVMLVIKSRRKYHAYEDSDDRVVFSYEVLPPK